MSEFLGCYSSSVDASMCGGIWALALSSFFVCLFLFHSNHKMMTISVVVRYSTQNFLVLEYYFGKP